VSKIAKKMKRVGKRQMAKTSLSKPLIRQIDVNDIVNRYLFEYGYWLLSRYPKLIPYPKQVYIEPTNICNLKCHLCPNKDIDPTRKGMMPLESFKKIIDNIQPCIKNVLLDLHGEALLNEQFWAMAKYCNEKGMTTSVDTNATRLDQFDPEQMFTAGLDSITFALDGATKDIYEKHRVNGDFDRVLTNIKNFCSERNRRKLSKPLTALQFVVTKKNQHQIGAIKNLARELGIDSVRIKYVHILGQYNDNLRQQLVDEWLPEERKLLYFYSLNHFHNCYKPFRTPVINWRGEMILCCEDFFDRYILGNVLEMPLKEVFRSARFIEITKKASRRELDICKNCDASAIESYSVKMTQREI
jgi:radical SAM protein with 4Fe4S-binding SPASM domain